MRVFMAILCSLMAVCSVSAQISRQEETDGQAAIYRLPLMERAFLCTRYFEGFMDFLSAATLGLETGDCLVLNSVSNVEKAMKYLDGYGCIDCYLDRDEAGRRTLEMLKGHYEERVCDRSALYDGCKDLNEYLQLTTKRRNEQ